MRRLIQVNGNKMYICSEAIGSQIAFARAVTVKITDDVITFKLASPGYYQIPEHLSAREQINYIVTCMTRADEGVVTDMHKFVDAFFDKTLGMPSCGFLFSRDGSLPTTEQPVHQAQNQF